MQRGEEILRSKVMAM